MTVFSLHQKKSGKGRIVPMIHFNTLAMRNNIDGRRMDTTTCREASSAIAEDVLEVLGRLFDHPTPLVAISFLLIEVQEN